MGPLPDQTCQRPPPIESYRPRSPAENDNNLAYSDDDEFWRARPARPVDHRHKHTTKRPDRPASYGDHAARAYKEYLNLRQGSRSVADYTIEFHRLSLRVLIVETERQQVTRCHELGHLASKCPNSQKKTHLAETIEEPPDSDGKEVSSGSSDASSDQDDVVHFDEKANEGEACGEGLKGHLHRCSSNPIAHLPGLARPLPRRPPIRVPRFLPSTLLTVCSLCPSSPTVCPHLPSPIPQLFAHLPPAALLPSNVVSVAWGAYLVIFLCSPEGVRQALTLSFNWQSTIFSCVFAFSCKTSVTSSKHSSHPSVVVFFFCRWVIVHCSLGYQKWFPLVGLPPHLDVSSLPVVLPSFVTFFGMSLLSTSDGASGDTSLAWVCFSWHTRSTFHGRGPADLQPRWSVAPVFFACRAPAVAAPTLASLTAGANLAFSMESYLLSAALSRSDFNCLLSPTDSSSPITFGSSVSAFRSFVEKFGLFDVPLSNDKFTWSNNRNPPILRRMDRVFLSDELFSAFPSSSLVLGPRHLSDHASLLLSLFRGRAAAGHARFCFELWWLRDDSFVAVVPKWWAHIVCGRWAAFRLSLKLHSIGREVLAWKHIFWSGKFSEVNFWDEEVLSIQSSDNISSVQSSRLLCLQCLAQEWRIRESIHWQKHSRLSWLSYGDQNSRFFHLTASQRRRQALLQSMVIRSRVFLGDDILPALTAHFRDFYSKPLRFCAPLPDFHLSSLTVSCAISLEWPFLHEEIMNVVWALGSGKAPDIDCFLIEFFRTFWEACSADVFEFCDEFACNFVFLKEFNQATCVLVPKRSNPMNVVHFCPISILGTPYKIIAKLLSLRLAPVLPYIINPIQVAFIKGRRLQDDMVLANEVIHSLYYPATVLLVEACFGWKATGLPTDYLGLQITLSPPAPSFWDGVEQKLVDRLQFDKIIREFIWDGDRPSDHLVHWDVAALPRLLGGAGITNLSWAWQDQTHHSPGSSSSPQVPPSGISAVHEPSIVGSAVDLELTREEYQSKASSLPRRPMATREVAAKESKEKEKTNAAAIGKKVIELASNVSEKKHDSEITHMRQDLAVVTRNIDEIRELLCSFLQYPQVFLAANCTPNICALGVDGGEQSRRSVGSLGETGVASDGSPAGNKSLGEIGAPSLAVERHPTSRLLTGVPLHPFGLSSSHPQAGTTAMDSSLPTGRQTLVLCQQKKHRWVFLSCWVGKGKRRGHHHFYRRTVVEMETLQATPLDEKGQTWSHFRLTGRHLSPCLPPPPQIVDRGRVTLRRSPIIITSGGRWAPLPLPLVSPICLT
ncbi:Transposon TX1 uncharacterized protein [Nymphaea thermarum]|nr:Transposon TX1 uncharacterized protein [Nymphaea thermarum]